MAALSTQRRSLQDIERQIDNTYQLVLQAFNHDFPKRPVWAFFASSERREVRLTTRPEPGHTDAERTYH